MVSSAVESAGRFRFLNLSVAPDNSIFESLACAVYTQVDGPRTQALQEGE